VVGEEGDGNPDAPQAIAERSALPLREPDMARLEASIENSQSVKSVDA
jgi:hypothetical protein